MIGHCSSRIKLDRLLKTLQPIRLGLAARLRERGVTAEIGEQHGRVSRDFRARITVVNINSQTVQVLGFIRLPLIPNARNGTDSPPRSGRCSCCQHPVQIFAWCMVMRPASHRANLRGSP